MTARPSSPTIHGCAPSSASSRVSLLFSIKDKVGALDEALSVLRRLNVSLSHIESRPSKSADWEYDFFVDFVEEEAKVAEIVAALELVCQKVKVVGAASSVESSIPWFPRKLSDLDTFADKVLECGEELSADHPGFNDQTYRARRDEITAIARTYRTGMPIPRIVYTEDEIATWGVVFNKLVNLFPTHACREHNYVFPLLIQNCGYRADNIPQLEDISLFLKDCTGFTLRPVMGLLTSRDFLNGLAFRVFHSTQYIRHHSMPLYTPEPDVCHELLGHVPLFADPEFADFSQEIGLASLGASDADIERLATIYWFTVEFGICRQNGELRAYGAGLLSSYGELEYCLSGKPQLLPFEPPKTALQKYPITEYQPSYFVAESFKDAKEKVREFALSLKRPFSVRYNPYTTSVEVLDKKEKIIRFVANLYSDMRTVMDALEKLE